MWFSCLELQMPKILKRERPKLFHFSYNDFLVAVLELNSNERPHCFFLELYNMKLNFHPIRSSVNMPAFYKNIIENLILWKPTFD